MPNTHCLANACLRFHKPNPSQIQNPKTSFCSVKNILCSIDARPTFPR